MAFGSEQWMYSAGGFYPHEIDNSVRFDDNAYLTRTPSSAGNRKTWTWSGWVKLSNSTGGVSLFSAGSASNSWFTVYIDGNAHIQVRSIVGGSNQFDKVSTQSFRDFSSWYHFVIEMDTTQSTAEDRVKVYVNGERITSWSGNVISSQNADTSVNNTNSHNIGRLTTGSLYLDGYMAEVNFVDGQALDATDFGEFKSGVWIPKKYTGTYGTNGFYLDFATRATDPIDASGNGNNWGSVNVVSTDWMLDSPTNNFATLNQINRNSTLTLAEGNLSLTSTAAQGAGCGVTMATSSGKWYYETVYVSGVSSYIHVGVIDSDATVAQLNTTNTVVNGTIYRGDGKIYENSGSGWVATQTVTAAIAGDIIGVAYDLDAQTCTYYLNNTQLGSSVSISYMNPEVMPYPLFGYFVAVMALNFGQDSSFAGQKTAQGNTDANGIGDFYYAPPAGYLALCSANLPDPAIDPAEDDIPADYFNTALYTGNGSTQSITGVGFQPDWVWTKGRSGSRIHSLLDVVRGANKYLSTNDTSAEATPANNNRITTIDADGFSLGNSTNVNASSETYVAWNWKAGGTAVANTDGTLASQVSANTKAGFSIVSYTGNGTEYPTVATVGHGLNQDPEMIIVKDRDTASTNWCVYNQTLALDQALLLNDAGGAQSSSNAFGRADPTSTVFTVGQAAGGSRTNDTGTYIAYCFHSAEGFSKFGSYTGNGSTDGTFVYTGFRPAYVMIKRTDSTNDWRIYDNKRSDYNEKTATLYANYALAEYTASGANEIDTLSNGFKIRNTNAGYNASGGTYIYMAFAEMPFKYANAR